MAIRVEEEFQHLDEQLSSDLNLDPRYLQRFFTSNIVQRALAYLLAWNYSTREPVRLTATSDGALRVSLTATGFEHHHRASGDATDTWTEIDIGTIAGRIDVWAWDADLLIDRSVDGITWDGEIKIPADSFYSFDCRTRKIRVKNADAGVTARYQVVGWY